MMSFGSITVESCKADTNQNIVGRTPPPPTLTPQMHLPPDRRQDTGQTRVSANQRGGARDTGAQRGAFAAGDSSTSSQDARELLQRKNRNTVSSSREGEQSTEITRTPLGRLWSGLRGMVGNVLPSGRRHVESGENEQDQRRSSEEDTDDDSESTELYDANVAQTANNSSQPEVVVYRPSPRLPSDNMTLVRDPTPERWQGPVPVGEPRLSVHNSTQWMDSETMLKYRDRELRTVDHMTQGITRPDTCSHVGSGGHKELSYSVDMIRRESEDSKQARDNRSRKSAHHSVKPCSMKEEDNMPLYKRHGAKSKGRQDDYKNGQDKKVSRSRAKGYDFSDDSAEDSCVRERCHSRQRPRCDKSRDKGVYSSDSPSQSEERYRSDYEMARSVSPDRRQAKSRPSRSCKELQQQVTRGSRFRRRADQRSESCERRSDVKSQHAVSHRELPVERHDEHRRGRSVRDLRNSSDSEDAESDAEESRCGSRSRRVLTEQSRSKSTGRGQRDKSRTDVRQFDPVSAHSRQPMKPGRFDGTQSLETFLAQFRTCAEYNKWNDSDRCAYLKCALTGEPAQLLWDSGDPDKLTYLQLEGRLRARYGSSGQAEKYKTELKARKRRQGESLNSLCSDVRRLMILAYPGTADVKLCEDIAIDHFLSALDDRKLELKLREREPTDLDTALRLAFRLEAYGNAYGGESTSDDGKFFKRDRDRAAHKLAQRIQNVEKSLEQQNSNDSGKIRELEQTIDKMARELGRYKFLEDQRRVHEADGAAHLKAGSSPTTRPDANPVTSIVCYKCGDKGHLSRNCHNNVQQRRQRCYECGNEGHMRRYCPKREERSASTAQTPGTQPADSDKQVNKVNDDDTEQRTYIRLRIQGTPVDCLLDTGSEITLVPWSLLQGAPMEPCELKVRAANGSDIPIMGRTRLIGGIGMHFMEIDAFVTKHISGVILGMGWLRGRRTRWDFDKGTVELDGQCYKLHARKRDNWCRRVVVEESTVVPAHSEFIFPGTIVYNDLTNRCGSETDVWATEVREVRPGLLVSRTIVPQRPVEVPVRVMNVLS
jgi:hypothetical protein